jgi:Asp-tRNA(Asn)/Glu-tRNA(Gln) amidotransferase A subunit family amidase
MVPWAIGTNTGRSVRIPAAWNGVTGLKTTIGRISTFGVLPLSPTLDTPGPIKRDVEDAAAPMAYDRSVDARSNLGAEIVDVALLARFADLGAVNGRIPVGRSLHGAGRTG